MMTIADYCEREARAAYHIELECGGSETSALVAYQLAYKEAERWAKLYPEMLALEEKGNGTSDDDQRGSS